MYRKLFLTILLFVFWTGFVAPATGGQVTLEVSTTTQVKDDRVLAAVKLTNRGTETAHQLRVLGFFGKEQQSAHIAEQIGPGQSRQAGIGFELPQGTQGAFPLYLLINYQHADGINVSSASLAVVNIGPQAETLVNVTAVKGENPGEVILQVDGGDTEIARLQLTGHGPADLNIEPHTKELQLNGGRGQTRFTVANVSGNPGSNYGIFFAAEYVSDGVHHLATAELNIPVEDTRTLVSSQFEDVKTWLSAFLMACIAVLAGIVILSSRARLWLFRVESVPHLLDIGVLIAVEVFIFSKFDLHSLVAATTTTGGDTASHFYTLQYFKDTLLSAGKISGWTMGNYAGFPILQFYFPLPFLIMSLLDLVMPLQVTFKLVTLLGTALLPVCAYVMLRLIRCPFPGPGIGAALMLPFLFNGAGRRVLLQPQYGVIPGPDREPVPGGVGGKIFSPQRYPGFPGRLQSRLYPAVCRGRVTVYSHNADRIYAARCLPLQGLCARFLPACLLARSTAGFYQVPSILSPGMDDQFS
jgi:hypothetical protein